MQQNCLFQLHSMQPHCNCTSSNWRTEGPTLTWSWSWSWPPPWSLSWTPTWSSGGVWVSSFTVITYWNAMRPFSMFRFSLQFPRCNVNCPPCIKSTLQMVFKKVSNWQLQKSERRNWTIFAFCTTGTPFGWKHSLFFAVVTQNKQKMRRRSVTYFWKILPGSNKMAL